MQDGCRVCSQPITSGLVWSKMWTGPGESAPKKAMTVPSAGKVMATIFWDSHGILLIGYPQKGKTTTGEYYASLLYRFYAILKEKRPYLAKKKSVSTTTMHQLTRVPLQRPNYLIYATKYFLIHLIPQIWLFPIIFCFLTWKLGLEVKDFHRTKRSLLRQMSILRVFIKITF